MGIAFPDVVLVLALLLATHPGSLALAEYPQQGGRPYAVRTREASGGPSEVTIDGVRVPFVQDGHGVTFPAGEDLGAGCAADDPADDGDASSGDEHDDEAMASGCGCRAVRHAPTGRVPVRAVLLGFAAAVSLAAFTISAWRRRRRR